ncbi:MAG: sulfurtransferase [Pseudomonadales bacterium]|nr:sulfurtransferase [Pseudomonadales bacterium]
MSTESGTSSTQNPGQVTTVDPIELSEILQTQSILLVQVTSAEVFAQAHIPGAVLVTPAELVSGIPPATGKLPDRDRLVSLFDRIGYSTDKDIIVYDDEGGGWAGRFGWTLDCIGHRDWRYLDGGLHAWAASELELAAGGEQTVAPTDNSSLEIDQKPIAEIPDVLAAIEDGSGVVLDVRSKEEHIGLKQASARVGHIPTAVNYDWLLMKDPQNHQILMPNLQSTLTGIGVDGSKPIITHCQTHHRSGLSYMVGRIFGYDIRAYHGSWSEWGNREDTPITNPSDSSGG